MDIFKPIRFIILVTCIVVVQPIRVTAQDASLSAIEGHAFDAKNGRPLTNVIITYSAVLANSTIVGSSTATDGNGFYQLDFSPPPDATSVEFFATCRTKKRGDVRYNGQFYLSARTQVYRRDFYLSLPRGVSTCN